MMKYLKSFTCRYCHCYFHDFGIFQRHRRRHEQHGRKTLFSNRIVEKFNAPRRAKSKVGENPDQNAGIAFFNKTTSTPRVMLQTSQSCVQWCPTCKLFSESHMEKNPANNSGSYAIKVCDPCKINVGFICQYCQQHIAKEDFMAHISEHHLCKFCHVCFTSEELHQHRIQIHRCPRPLCDVALPYGQLYEHTRTEHVLFYCRFCCKCYGDDNALTEHGAEEHACSICKVNDTSLTYLRGIGTKHLVCKRCASWLSGRFECPYCHLGFQEEILQYHIDIEHKCEFCKACFTWNALQLHYQSNHKCPYCDSIMRYADLSKHIATCHLKETVNDQRKEYNEIPDQRQVYTPTEKCGMQATAQDRVVKPRNATVQSCCYKNTFYAFKDTVQYEREHLQCTICKEKFKIKKDLIWHWSLRQPYLDRTQSCGAMRVIDKKSQLVSHTCISC